MRATTFEPVQVTDARSFETCVARARLSDEELSAAVPSWEGTYEYCHAFLRRKLILAQMMATLLHQRRVDWADVTLETIKASPPDQSKVIDMFPRQWSAADLSQFLFERTDWAIFVPLFGCLFKEVCDKMRVEEQVLEELVASPEFGEVAAQHLELHGIAGHPYTLVPGFGPPAKWPCVQAKA